MRACWQRNCLWAAGVFFLLLGLAPIRSSHALDKGATVTADVCRTGGDILDGNGNLIGCNSGGGSAGNGSSASAGPAGGGSRHTSSNTQSTVNQSNSKNPRSDCDKNSDTASAATGGDPIDTSSGSKIEEVTDFAEPGEMGLTFVRYYNSRSSCTGTSTCMASVGAWTTNLDYRLYVTCTQPPGNNNPPNAMSPDQLPGGGSPAPCGPVYYARPDGSTLPFPSTSAFYGTPGATVDIPGPFNADGTATLTNNGNGTYTVHDEDARNLTFNAQGALQSITDTSGISWTLTYPDANTVVVTHTNGQSFTLQRSTSSTTYGTAMQINVTDPAGNVYTYQSTAGVVLQPVSQIGVISSVTLPGSPSTVVGYQYFADVPGTGTYAQLKEVDYNGVAHDLTTYDSAGRASMTSLADGNEKTSVVYGSNSTGATATVTNPLGHVSVYQYNSSQLLVSVTGNASTYCAATFAQNTYDANGNLQTSKDNNGNVTAYTYDANGLLQKKTEAQGSNVQRITDIVWDPTPGTVRPSSTTIEGYAKTTYAYDAHNRLSSVAVTNLSGNGAANQTLTTSYIYVLYGNGLVQTQTVVQPSPNNSDTDVYTYDALGRVISMANGLGQATTVSNYTALGRPQKIVGPNGDETDYTYDARDRIQSKTTHPNGTVATWTYAYDGFGLLSSLTEPDGVVSEWNRDADMRVHTITHTEKDGTSTETLGYDANSDVSSRVITRGSVTALSESMSYDELGRLREKDGANGQKQTYQYDLDGNVQSVTNALGHTVAYQYDALNRVRQVTESGGASLSAPTLSVPASSATGSYTVSWNATSNTTSYTLREQVNGGGWSTIYTGGSTSLARSGKGDGSYGYQVQACNVAGCGDWSATASINVLLPPPAPASVNVPASSNNSVAVSWPSASTATSYAMQQAFNGGAWSTIYTGAALSYTKAETASGSYAFRVQACNAGGCSAYTTSSAVAVTVPPATAPSLSVPTSNGTGSYTVSWGGVSGGASFYLREQVNGGGWSTVYGGSGTSLALSGKASGSSYGYDVQACNSAGCGPWSATQTVSVLWPPAAPVHLYVATPEYYPGPNWVLNWPSVFTATSYTLQRTTVGSGTFATVYSGPAISTSNYGVPGTYQYRVQACNAAGCSGWTSSANVDVECNESAVAAKADGAQPLNLKCNGPAIEAGTP